MKVIIAGSRDFTDSKALSAAAEHFCDSFKCEITKVISGTARGADELGEKWAIEHGVDVIRMPAQWHKYGRSSGYRRNEEMAKIADGCIVMWKNHSKGSGHMIEIAKQYKLCLWIHHA